MDKEVRKPQSPIVRTMIKTAEKNKKAVERFKKKLEAKKAEGVKHE